MSSSASVKLRYEKCLQVWGNATRNHAGLRGKRCRRGIFLASQKKRKKEEKGRRGMKELAILHRLHRLPRKPAWLMGFQRWAIAVMHFNPRQNNPPPLHQTTPDPTVQNTGGPNERLNLY
ncbi:hypothetical protein ACHEXK_10860 [Limnohabitans sp. DCL3]|uniref:hypothetical protein n=1 Tax=Limnohabitans sp. DCL3 TaxID=3374103 RepID=UPI003A86F189